MRVGNALRALSGRAGEETRAIVPLSYPNFPAGSQQMALVRTANPGEYRYDGATIRVQGFSKHPVVHACIRAVADIVASVPLVVLKERGNYESRVGDDHPLQKLLDYPAPRLTARQFRAKFAVDYLGYGNSFFQLERTAPNRPPVSLRPINAEAMQQVWIDPEGDPRRYDYANWAGIVVQVPVEDLLHFKDLDMPRPFQADVFGYPRGATAIGSMLADNEATQYVRQVVTNDGTPTFAVIMSDEATSEDAATMQDRYKARIVDRGKRGTPAFFGAVKDIKPLGFTLSDLEFPDLRRISREDICAAFGVDPRMIGIGSASSDGGLSGVQYVEARARLVQHTIEPMFSVLEDEINHWLAPEFGDVWVTYDHDMLRDLVEDDVATSTRIRAEYDMGLRTWEESRSAIRLSPLPNPTDSILKTTGKDLIPAAVAVINPSDVMDTAPATDNEMPQVGGPTAKQITAGATDTVPGEGATPDVVEPPVRRIDRLQVRAYFEDALEGEQIEQLVELLEALVEKELPPQTVKAALLAAFPNVDPALINEMVAGLEGFEPPPEEPEAPEAPPAPMSAPADEDTIRKRSLWERANAELDRTEQGYKSTAEALFRAERPKMTKAISAASDFSQARKAVRQAYAQTGDFAESWNESFTPLIAKTYSFGATEVAGVGAGIAADTVESGLVKRSVTSVTNAIKKRAKKLSERVGETTADEVVSVLVASEKAGMTIAETARLVALAVYGEERIDARSTMIARTEAAGALSQGSWDQAQEMGGVYRSKEWLAFSDKETRDTHTACMAEGRIAIDQPFASNGLMYPLDPSGDAGEVINCRCVLAYSDEPA